MPAIQVRPAVEADIPNLVKIDHTYTTNRVWQIEQNVEAETSEEGSLTISIRFREVRLPREIHVDYPLPPRNLLKDWSTRSALLVASLRNTLVGYIGLAQNRAPRTVWVTDLVVDPRQRRQGIGSALVLAALDWGSGQAGNQRLTLEMQHKNIPAIYLAEKLGFNFSGYDDHYYPNQDLALFFTKWF